MTATPSFSAARSAGDSLPASTNQRLRLEIFEVELELVLPISGIERRRGRRGGHAEKRRRHFGSVRQHDGDPIAAANSEFVERALRAIDKRTQTRVAQRRAPCAAMATASSRPDAMRPLRVRSALMVLNSECAFAEQATVRSRSRATVWPKSFVTA